MESWQKIDEKTFYKGYLQVDLQRWQLPGGHIHNFDIIIGQSGATVLAITADSKVILTRQFRPGPAKLLYELPGGAVDPGESPLEAAKRELLEETGYSGDVQFLRSNFMSAYSTSQKHHCLATNCRKVAEPKTELGEMVEVSLMPLAEFRKRLFDEDFRQIETAYLGLDRLGLL